MLRVCDIMTKGVATLAPESTLREALDLLVSRHVGAAPVLVGSRVVGLISAVDLLAFIGATGNAAANDSNERSADPSCDAVPVAHEIEASTAAAAAYFDTLWNPADSDAADRPARVEPAARSLDASEVRDAMTRGVVALPPEASVVTAARLMKRYRIHRVLVMRGNALLGLLSMSDITRIVAERWRL